MPTMHSGKMFLLPFFCYVQLWFTYYIHKSISSNCVITDDCKHFVCCGLLNCVWSGAQASDLHAILILQKF